jgi:hypothetical protein
MQNYTKHNFYVDIFNPLALDAVGHPLIAVMLSNLLNIRYHKIKHFT